ncbi:MAG: GTP-binding protein, partial [Chitinophagia bacterium]|nr:GTP-binding protein [Chitinophagia bacterium]
ITITSAATTCFWNGHHINIIDTPGHVDFTIEVGRSLRVLDGVVAVFCGVAGVQPQSETVWRQATRYRVPRIVFVNKLDRIGADYFRVVADINNRLNGNALAMQIPVGVSENLCGIIDILERRMAVYDEAGSAELAVKFVEVPDEYKDKLEELRVAIIERAADFDEDLAEKYLNGEEVTIAEVKKALRKGVLIQQVVPAFCGTAFKNKGVQLLLDAVVDYLPSPLDVPPVPTDIPIVDTTGTLTFEQKNSLAASIAESRAKTSNQIAILMIPSLENDSLEEYSIKVAREWGIGTKDKNNGVLIFIAKNDRKIRIEVGYGLEGALTDAKSSQIIRNVITPEFRQDKYFEGLSAGLQSIQLAIQNEFDPALD